MPFNTKNTKELLIKNINLKVFLYNKKCFSKNDKEKNMQIILSCIVVNPYIIKEFDNKLFFNGISNYCWSIKFISI